MVTILGPEYIELLAMDMILGHHSVGFGDFACCTLNHTIQVDGKSVPIPCDRGRVSSMLLEFYEHNLANNIQKANASSDKDFSEYRFNLSIEHIILGNLPCSDDRPKLDSWPAFAEAFRLDMNQPLMKSGGALNWSPLIWAVISNNDTVVKSLID